MIEFNPEQIQIRNRKLKFILGGRPSWWMGLLNCISADPDAALRTQLWPGFQQFQHHTEDRNMKSKKLLSALLRIGMSCALLSLLTISAFAQLGRIEGEVVKAGSTEPVANAAVSIVRMDIKGNYDLKTDKKGKFLHAGVPYAGNYTILVSADGFEP